MIGRVLWLPAIALFATGQPPSQTPATQARDPVRWSANVTDAKRAVRPGDRFDVQLSAQLDQGWHLYSLTPVPQGPAPTIIGLPDGQPFALAGEITEPLPQSRYDPNFDRDTWYFDDAVTFVVPVKVEATARPGAQSVSVAVSFQVCDSHLCLPPKRVVVAAALTVAAERSSASAVRAAEDGTTAEHAERDDQHDRRHVAQQVVRRIIDRADDLHGRRRDRG
jgi:thiol:disulfide interchange protein DsbD